MLLCVNHYYYIPVCPIINSLVLCHLSLSSRSVCLSQIDFNNKQCSVASH